MKKLLLALLALTAVVATAVVLVKKNRNSKSGYVPECGDFCDGIMFECMEGTEL